MMIPSWHSACADWVRQILSTGPSLRPPSSAAAPPVVDQLMVQRLIKAYGAFESAGGAKKLATDVEALAPHLQSLLPSIIQLGHLLENLIQEVEKLYGQKSGNGAYKKQQVKSAILYLIANSHLNLPKLPPFLLPFLSETVVDWAIDSIVAVLNKHEAQLWASTSASASPAICQGFFSRWLAAVSNWLARWGWKSVLSNYRVAAPLKPVLDQMLAELKRDQKPNGAEFFYFIDWLASHRIELMALLNVLDEAVLLAEGFLEKNGAQKKQYVMELLQAFLLEMGWPIDQPTVTNAVINQLLDFSIDFIVDIYNRRKLFQ